MEDYWTEKLVTALMGLHNLLLLSFWENAGAVEERGAAALAALLQNPTSNLITLDLSGCDMYDEEPLRILAKGLSDNKSLKLLNLSNVSDHDAPTLPATGWRALSLMSPNCTLEKLDLSDNYIDDESLPSLAYALVNMTAVKILNLHCHYHRVGFDGWRQLSAAIGQNCALEELTLNPNTITDEGLTMLIVALHNCSSLKVLKLRFYFSSVTKARLIEVVSLLLNPNSVLEEVHLGFDFCIDDDVVIAFARALRGNKRLKALVVNGARGGHVSAIGWVQFSISLCDTSSPPTSIFESNHTLERLSLSENFQDVELPHNLALLLKMNAVRNKILVAGTKIISLLKLEHIMDMELKVLPRTISWIGNKHRGQISRRYSRLYELIRNKPSLFGNHKRC